MYQLWQRKSALKPLNALCCVLIYFIKIKSNFKVSIHSLAQELLSRGLINLQFLVDPSLYIIFAYLICMNHVPEYKRLREEMLNFHNRYMTYFTIPQPKNPWSGVTKFIILVYPSQLVIISILTFWLVFDRA